MTEARRSVVLGILLLARGRADGLGQFGATPAAFLASLAPLVAFPLVGAGLAAARGQGEEALLRFLATICALLVAPVLSHALARRWGREAAWLRYATAFNWCSWTVPLAALVLDVALGVLVAAGVPPGGAAKAGIAGCALYGLWLHWFLARHGLGLSWLRAAGLAGMVDAATALVVLGPLWVAAWVEGGA